MISWIGREYQALLSAVMFLTRVPVPSWVTHEPTWLARSMLYFPLVGWVIGFMSATVMLVARWIFPSASPLLAAFLSLATTVYVTGAFHEDGFADSCDGLGGGWTKSQRVQIMKDSRIGVFGAIGLLLFVGVKTCALASLPDEMVVLACCISHVLGKSSSLPLLLWYPLIEEDVKSSTMFKAAMSKVRVTLGCLLAACLVIASTALALHPHHRNAPPSEVLVLIGMCFAMCMMVTAKGGEYVAARLEGGFTGDCLGGINQLVEVVTLLVFASSIGTAAANVNVAESVFIVS